MAPEFQPRDENRSIAKGLTSKTGELLSKTSQRGYSRDHRSDCKQVVLALVVTRDGFPLAHRTLAGNTQDLQTVETLVTEIEHRFGMMKRI